MKKILLASALCLGAVSSEAMMKSKPSEAVAHKDMKTAAFWMYPASDDFHRKGFQEMVSVDSSHLWNPESQEKLGRFLGRNSGSLKRIHMLHEHLRELDTFKVFVDILKLKAPKLTYLSLLTVQLSEGHVGALEQLMKKNKNLTVLLPKYQTMPTPAGGHFGIKRDNDLNKIHNDLSERLSGKFPGRVEFAVSEDTNAPHGQFKGLRAYFPEIFQ